MCAGEVRNGLEKLLIWREGVKRCYVILGHVGRRRVNLKSLGIDIIILMGVMFSLWPLARKLWPAH